jgi:orotate phosphoribosyltransferase
MPSSTLEPYKADFIKQAIDNGVLLFGEFTLKSGR